MNVPAHCRKDAPIDLKVEGRSGDTILLLCPLTPRGKAWIDDNISDEATFLGDNLAVEHRYISDIIVGAVQDGLKVR